MMVLVFASLVGTSSKAMAQSPVVSSSPSPAATVGNLAPAGTASPIATHSTLAALGHGFSSGFGNKPDFSAARYFIFLPFLLFFVVFWYFIRLFATALPSDTEAEQMAISRMVRFCYGFTLFSFLVIVSPFAALNLLPPSITSSYYVAMAESPVALVLGCVHYANPEDRANELACKTDRFANEWLVNIGGLVLQRLPYAYPIATPPPTAPVNAAEQAVPPEADETTDWVDGHIGTPMLDLPPMTIHEGLTVPFYFILVALFGAAVSLARRVPEIQRKYHATEGDQINASETRELLVSQILQFLSAPIIAMTAYAVFAPSGPSSSVVLAFVSGFSSDAVIAGFKALADRIISSAAEKTSGTSTTVSNPPPAAAGPVAAPPVAPSTDVKA
ncbi:MAG TPA: hypothetical protein VJN94_08650 [Candidatus Binataceae bacterium]|nr:hypothetical protein [Candidatus Binataceae bacterium]